MKNESNLIILVVLLFTLFTLMIWAQRSQEKYDEAVRTSSVNNEHVVINDANLQADARSNALYLMDGDGNTSGPFYATENKVLEPFVLNDSPSVWQEVRRLEFHYEIIATFPGESPQLIEGGVSKWDEGHEWYGQYEDYLAPPPKGWAY